jgi:hypothetical protein
MSRFPHPMKILLHNLLSKASAGGAPTLSQTVDPVRPGLKSLRFVIVVVETQDNDLT